MAGSSWGGFFRGPAARVRDFFRELGGPISIIMVAGFALASTLWSGPGTLSRPLHDYSIATNVIWVMSMVFALLAVIFGPRSDASRFWDFIKRWGGLIALALLLVFPFLTGSSSTPAKAGLSPQAIHWQRASVVVLLTLSLIVPVGWKFLDVFTSPLKNQTPKEVSDAVYHMVRFCYLFMLIALFVSFLPPFIMGIVYLGQESVPGEPPQPKPGAPPSLTRVFYDAMVDSPVGLVRGCVHAPKEPDWELACHSPEAGKSDSGDIYSAQWLFNIGGSAQWRSDKNDTSDQKPQAPAQAHAVGANQQPSQTPSAGATAQAPAPGQAAGANQKPSATPPSDANKVEPKPSEAVFYPVTIYGGLAVPWYFIMLAVMGAAVSMARRVPEYQREVQITDTNDDAKTSRATGDPDSPTPTPKTDAKDPGAAGDPNSLSPRRVRELMVFQIMQVLSAPLIAITAYNAVMPSSRATSVALAFVSGFSSESVLLVIRALAEKIRPEETAPTSATTTREENTSQETRH